MRNLRQYPLTSEELKQAVIRAKIDFEADGIGGIASYAFCTLLGALNDPVIMEKILEFGKVK